MHLLIFEEGTMKKIYIKSNPGTIVSVIIIAAIASLIVISYLF